MPLLLVGAPSPEIEAATAAPLEIEVVIVFDEAGNFSPHSLGESVKN